VAGDDPFDKSALVVNAMLANIETLITGLPGRHGEAQPECFATAMPVFSMTFCAGTAVESGSS
jgi:hypothetical protein